MRNTREGSASYLSTLAQAFYVDKQNEEAISTIKKAIALAPEENAYREWLRMFEEAKARP